MTFKIVYIVAFAILPLFAIANTAISIPSSFISGLKTSNGLGIMFGLVVGSRSEFFFSLLRALHLEFCTLPDDLKKKHLWGAGMLAGIGFTMSIFITLLACTDAEAIGISKFAIIVASLFAGLAGLAWLHITLQPGASDVSKKGL